jgi:hypothetical protein
MAMRLQCSTCGRDTLCEECAWDAYCGEPIQHINISSGEDVCLQKESACCPPAKASNDLLLLPHVKGKKSREGTTVIVKPIPANEILQEE